MQRQVLSLSHYMLAVHVHCGQAVKIKISLSCFAGFRNEYFIKLLTTSTVTDSNCLTQVYQ